jgi:hypothetical protein
MKPNSTQMKRVAQHLNSLRVDERYRKTYLDCLDPTAKKRPGASECAKAELMIVQKLVARAPTPFPPQPDQEAQAPGPPLEQLVTLAHGRP